MLVSFYTRRWSKVVIHWLDYRMDLNTILVFYDGMDIQKYSNNPFVKGFTTNCTVFSKWQEKNYQAYYNSVKDYVGDKSVSFQIWEDNTDLAINQIDSVYTISPTIYVKIPIINSEGNFNDDLYKYAMSNKMNINITCLYTNNQVTHAWNLLKDYKYPMIVSIFAGPISDTGVDPTPFVLHAVDTFEPNLNAKILWAGCREVYAIKKAADLGCHIITAPDTVIDKLPSLGKDLTVASVERVQTFRNDAIKSKLIL